MFEIDEKIQQQSSIIKNLMTDFYYSKYFNKYGLRNANTRNFEPTSYAARQHGFKLFSKQELIDKALEYIDFNKIASDVPRDVSMDMVRELIIERMLEEFPYEEKLEEQKAKEVE